MRKIKSTSKLEIKSLEYKKKWKTNVWSLDFGQKIKFHFFLQKMHAHAIGGELLFWLVTKNAQRKVGRNQIWKTSLWTTKQLLKWTFEISIWVKKLQNYFFFKYVLAPDKVIFFCIYNQKMHKKELFKLVRVKIEK